MDEGCSEASVNIATGCGADSSPYISDEIKINGGVRSNPFGCPAETRKRRSRLLCHSRSYDQENHAKKSSLLKIFSWFQGKVKRSDSLGTCSRTTEGSVSTLSGSIPDNIFVPLSKSRSADNQSILDQSVDISQQRKGTARFIPRSSSFTENNARSSNFSDAAGNVQSEDTISSDQKKRAAPLPPSAGGSRSDSHRQEDSPVNRLRKDSDDFSLNGTECNRSSKRNAEPRKDAVRIKRKAPEPPSNTPPHLGSKQPLELPRRSASATTEMFNSSVNAEEKAQSIPSTLRSTTSQNSVRCSMSSNSSVQSIFAGEAGNLSESPTSRKSSVDSCSKFLKPWYKRRTKCKVAKVPQKHDVIDQVYEFWRPELQFSDGKISVSPSSQSPCGTVQSEKSVLQKVVDSCKTKRKSQISLLSNISQLNLEAEVELKREKTLNSKEGSLADPNSPKTHFLTQQDLTQSSKIPTEKLNTTANSLEPRLEASRNEMGSRIHSQETSSNMQEISSQTKQMQVNKKTITREVTTSSLQAVEISSNNHRASVAKESNGVKKNNPLVSPSQSPSLIQMANLDAEQFYKLAKDIKTPIGKSPSPPTAKTRARGGVEPVSRSNFGEPTKSNRNFGLRMNQLFAPDVSVILEASESVTSSGTVPHDDCFSDQNSVLTRNFDCIYEDLSIRNDSLFDSRLHTANAREIMEELADVRQEIERINEEENEAEHKKLKRDEKRNITERINEARRKIELSNEASLPDAKLSPPLDVPPRPEAKLRWECSMCTLINVPWRITCEACTSRRPTNPTRIAEDGSRLPPSKTDSDDQGCESTFTEIDDRTKEQMFVETAVRAKCSESERPVSKLMKAEKQAQWELELRKYFGAKDFSKGLQEHSQESIVIFNKVDKKSEPSGTGHNINSKVGEFEPNLNEVRRARLQKFKLQESGHFENSQGEDFQRSALPRNESFKQDLGRVVSETEIDAFLFQCNKDKNFYKNDAPKRLIISPAGAVKNTIHIFDQKPETENQTEKNLKIKQNRRKSVGLVKTQASLFEKNDLNCDSESSNLKGFSKNIQDSKQAVKNPEVDISSAISKFDEIAALAEIERLKPMLLKPNPTKPRKKIIIHTKEDSNQFFSLNHLQVNGQRFPSPNSGGKDELDLSRRETQQRRLFQNIDSSQQESGQPDLEQGIHKEYDRIIGETGAETSHSRDSSSFLSSSFDLMEVSEFQQIEAEHSQRGSPITSFYEDAYQADYDSDSTELFLDASSADMSETGLEENINPTSASPGGDLYQRPQVLEVDDQQRLAVEELSHQLTLKKGIADFKATMSAECSGWSSTSTMRISQLLKKLEAAIGRGDHSDAANLARELATLKVACNVTGGGRKENADTASNITRSNLVSNIRTTNQNNNLEAKQQCSPRETTSGAAASKAISSQKANLVDQLQGFLGDSAVHHLGIESVLNNDVTIRDHKSSPDRRKVKSDTVSKLIETNSSDIAINTGAFRVQLFVEDRSSHQGPLSISVTSSMTVGELRSVVFEKFGFPPAVQRWILGRRLAEDDNATLSQHKVTREGCPLFLYLVAPPTASTSDSQNDEDSTKTPEMTRYAKPEQQLINNQRKHSSSNDSPNLLISPLAASRNPLKIGRYAPSAPAEDPVVGNELIRREMNEQELQSQSSGNFRPKNLPPTVDPSVAIPEKNRGQIDISVSRRDSSFFKSVQKDQNGQIEMKVDKKSSSQSKTSRSTQQKSSETKQEKRSDPSKNQPTERRISGHPSNAVPSNTRHSKDHLSNAHLSNAHNSNSNNSNSVSSSDATNGWICRRCTFVNDVRRPGCEVCGSEKPSDRSDPQFYDDNAYELKQLDRAVSALEKDALVKCTEAFECRVCFSEVPPRAGVVLRECLHVFCRECLANAVRYSDTAAVKCLYRDDSYACDATIQDREVKALVSAAEYEAHLNKSVKQAAGSMQNVFHCKTPDCRGFCVFEDNVNTFLCSVCYKQNCLTCQAQHTGLSCKKYQEMISQKEDIDSLKTQKFFEDMISRGDGMPCPHCRVMLMRKWGCDWMRCPMCRTEICWVTRGPRWGPKGTGDVSGGCQCGINGRKCHPKCTYCH